MVHISTDVTYALKVGSSGYYLDGRDYDHKNPLMTGTDNAQTYGASLHWKFEKLSNDKWAIKCVRNGYYLDGRDGNKTDPYVTNAGNPETYGSVVQWNIEDNGSDGYVSLQCSSNNYYLDGRDSKHNNPKMANRSASGDFYLSWKLVPLNCTVHANITNFDYGDAATVQEILENSKWAQSIQKETVDCNELGLTVKSSFTDSFTNSYEYGFDQTIGGGCGASITCGVPTIAETTVYVDFDMTFGSNQSWTETTEQTITEEYMFEPQEIGTYEVGMIVYLSDNIELPFAAKVLFTAKDYNADSNGKECTGDDILSIIDFYGNNCEINQINDNSVEATITGVLKGGWYVDTYVGNRKVDDASSATSYMNKIAKKEKIFLKSKM